jgi:deoxyribodipyrimidine photolyase-related protein
MSVRSIRLILGDQLNINHSWFEKVDDGIIYVMAEQRSETDYTLHHAQKLIAVLSAMRRFAADLEARGHRLRYFRLGDADNPQNFPDTLATVVQEHKPARFEWQTPDEYRLQRIIAQAAEGFEREEGWKSGSGAANIL